MYKAGQKNMFSGFGLKNGIVITPLLLFYLELGLICTKNYRFVRYALSKCLNIYVQSHIGGKRTKIQVPMLMRKLGNCSPTVPTVTKLRIVVVILSINSRMMRTRTQQ